MIVIKPGITVIYFGHDNRYFGSIYGDIMHPMHVITLCAYELGATITHDGCFVICLEIVIIIKFINL